VDPFMLSVIVVVLAFVAVVLRTSYRWKGVWRWLAILPLALLAWAVVNIERNIEAHNLLPFELLIWVVFGLILLGVLSAIRSRVAK